MKLNKIFLFIILLLFKINYPANFGLFNTSDPKQILKLNLNDKNFILKNIKNCLKIKSDLLSEALIKQQLDKVKQIICGSSTIYCDTYFVEIDKINPINPIIEKQFNDLINSPNLKYNWICALYLFRGNDNLIPTKQQIQILENAISCKFIHDTTPPLFSSKKNKNKIKNNIYSRLKACNGYIYKVSFANEIYLYSNSSYCIEDNLIWLIRLYKTVIERSKLI